MVRSSLLCGASASLVFLLLGASPSVAAPAGFTQSQNYTCRVLPTDASWPDTSRWNQLNTTVKGKLIKTVPLASICHGTLYNEQACDQLRTEWPLPEIHETSASSIQAPWFQNATCDPYTPVADECRLGNYASYSIEVLGVDDAVAGVKFAQENNVRLVVKNTGHDYLGKSTGAGGLGLWTHGMNSSTFISNYSSSYYSGPAFRFGSGILGYQAYQAARAHNMRVVGGDCPSVGLAGGYTQGGGHSMLSTQNGMGADQVLEWEVVTAIGEHLIATPTQNQDLYWALSGGGGGTYAVVISLTVRVFPDERTGGASIAIPSSDIDADEDLWTIYKAWQDGIPSVIDTGATAIYVVTPAGFFLLPLTLPGATEAEVRDVLFPFTKYLDQRNRTYTINVTSHDSYFDHFLTYFGPLPNGPLAAAELVGGRMIPRSTLTQNSAALVSGIRKAVAQSPFVVSSVAMSADIKPAGKALAYGGARTSAPVAANAVLPAWRDTIIHLVLNGVWNFNETRAQHQADMDVLTNQLDPMFKEITGSQGANYLNEANFVQPDFKKDFYGANYPALRSVKAKYDPHDLFWARTAVGSDEWWEDGEGRLCKR